LDPIERYVNGLQRSMTSLGPFGLAAFVNLPRRSHATWLRLYQPIARRNPSSNTLQDLRHTLRRPALSPLSLARLALYNITSMVAARVETPAHQPSDRFSIMPVVHRKKKMCPAVKGKPSVDGHQPMASPRVTIN
jgi:hypothetical protein